VSKHALKERRRQVLKTEVSKQAAEAAAEAEAAETSK